MFADRHFRDIEVFESNRKNEKRQKRQNLNNPLSASQLEIKFFS